MTYDDQKRLAEHALSFMKRMALESPSYKMAVVAMMSALVSAEILDLTKPPVRPEVRDE